MSATGIQGFVEATLKDEAAVAELAKVVETAQGGDVASAVVAHGAKKGFQFSKQDAIQASKSLQAIVAQEAGEELSDEQLETVAGGSFATWGTTANQWLRTEVKAQATAWNTLGRNVKAFFSGW